MPGPGPISTSHGEVAVLDVEGPGLPLLFLHGNSSCKEVFVHQLEGPLRARRRLIAIDFPGCGASDDARDPARTYNMAGYAGSVMEVLAALGVSQAAVFGWSLGGHVALELLPRFDGLAGLMIAATAPVHPTPEAVFAAYRQHHAVALIAKEVFTAEEARSFAEALYGTAVTPELVAAARRADGRARRLVLETAFDGPYDQRVLAETATKPIAVVNGADDPIVNVDYVASLAYPTLWEGRCFEIPAAGHAAFLSQPAAFNPILERFVASLSHS
ncbi:MAG: alpha/beta fold hydrolase [Bauldia sp.]